jgi:hypothetical protein
MRSKFVTLALLMVFSAVFGYVGHTLGDPATLGPCLQDASNTCAFPCTPLAGTPYHVASSAITQIPYCADIEDTCNPLAVQYQCSMTYWYDSSCQTFYKSGTTTSPGCQ